MLRTLQIKRGPRAQLPTLAPGELAFTTDEQMLYVGSSSGNKRVAMLDLLGRDNICFQDTKGIEFFDYSDVQCSVKMEENALVLHGYAEQSQMRFNEDGSTELMAENGLHVDCTADGAGVINLASGGCELRLGYEGDKLYMHSSDDIVFGNLPQFQENGTGPYYSIFPIYYKNCVVAANTWVANSTYAAQGFNWRAPLPTYASSYYMVTVLFAATDQFSGNFGLAESTDSGTFIYAMTKPAVAMTIPAVKLEEVYVR